MVDNYFESEEFIESLSRYEKSVRDGDSFYMDSDDFINISDYYIENGNVEDAYQCLTKAIRVHPNVVSVQVAYAGVLVCLFRFDEVSKIIKDIDEKDAYDVLYLRAQLCIAIQHDLNAAEDYFSRWLVYIYEEAEDDNRDENFDPDIFTNDSLSRDALFRIMMSYVELCEEKQDEYIRKWVYRYLHDFSHLGFFKADYSVMETCRNLAYFDILEEYLPKILEINPYMENGWTILGVSQHMNAHDNEAASSFEYALAINPDDALANITYAHSLLTFGNFEQALKYLLHFRLLTDVKSEDLYIGKCYYKLNDFKNALLYFHTPYVQFMESPLNDDMIDSCFELAESFFACDDMDSAEDLLEKILDVNPTHHFALMLSGCIYLSKDDFENALQIFSMELERYNYSVSIVLDVASRFLAYDYNQMSIYLLETVREQSKKNEEYRTFAILAMAYIKEGKLDNALKDLRIACKKAPAIVKYYYGQFLPDTVLPGDYYIYLAEYFNNYFNKNINK